MKLPPIHHNVLWADDDSDDLQLMREVMEQIDSRHHIVEASNGQQVLDLLEQVYNSEDLPCLIVLDMNMPVLNGRETLERIKADERFHQIPVVIFTTSARPADREFCLQYGVDMLTKPCQYKGFGEVVRTVLSYCSYN